MVVPILGGSLLIERLPCLVELEHCWNLIHIARGGRMGGKGCTVWHLHSVFMVAIEQDLLPYTSAHAHPDRSPPGPSHSAHTDARCQVVRRKLIMKQLDKPFQKATEMFFPLRSRSRKGHGEVKKGRPSYRDIVHPTRCKGPPVALPK